MKTQAAVVALAGLAFSAMAFAQPVNQAVVTGCYLTPAAAAALGSTVATGTSCESAFQIRYFANLTVGDSFIDATNDGSVITAASVNTPTNLKMNYSTGNICINVYAFDPAEELVSCCSCLVTPNGLVSLSAQQDLISNTLTPASPTAITVKLLSTTPIVQGSNPLTATQSCNPSFPSGLNAISGGGIPTILLGGGVVISPVGGSPSFQNTAPAMHAWGSTLHARPGGFKVTETPFASAALGDTDATTGAVKQNSEFTRISTQCGFIQSNGSGFGTCKSCRAGGLGADKQ